MTRVLIFLLCLANIGYYAWTQGWLDHAVGLASNAGHEPGRLGQQVHPELITLQAPASAHPTAGPSSAAETSAAAPALNSKTAPAGGSAAASATASTASCMRLGPYTQTQFDLVAQQLHRSFAQVAWTKVRVDKPGLWLVYMGRYESQDLLEKKEEELHRIHVVFEEVLTPADLAFGLSLGRFDNRDAANTALSRLALHGIHTARLVMLRPEQSNFVVQIPELSATDEQVLRPLINEQMHEALGGATMSTCASDDAQ